MDHMTSGEVKPFESLGTIFLSKEEKHFSKFGTKLNNLITCSNAVEESEEDILYYSSDEDDSSDDGMGLHKNLVELPGVSKGEKTIRYLNNLCQSSSKITNHFTKKTEKTANLPMSLELLLNTKFILVCDFEATCDLPSNPKPREPIEVAILPLQPKLAALAPVAPLIMHIRPTVHPELSQFCTGLTGISQHSVDQAPGFLEAVKIIEK